MRDCSSFQHQNLFRFVTRRLVAPSLCLCCFQILNNSVISHCSLQLFLPCDPQSRRKQHIHPRMYVQRQYVLVCSVPFCIPSHILFHAQGIAFVRPFLFGRAGSLHRGAKLKSVLREPGLDSVRGCCLMCHPWPQAMKQRGSYAQQPWPESVLLHNSSPQYFCSCKLAVWMHIEYSHFSLMEYMIAYLSCHRYILKYRRQIRSKLYVCTLVVSMHGLGLYS